MGCFAHAFLTRRGWMAAVATSLGLSELVLPRPSKEAALRSLTTPLDDVTFDAARFDDLPERLDGYFAGHVMAIEDPIDVPAATDFQRTVWGVTCTIPAGQTRTYAWVARAVGRPNGARAVGQALGSNPVPIVVPCHRVVAANGGLVGYSGGLAVKRSLLALEQGRTARPITHR